MLRRAGPPGDNSCMNAEEIIKRLGLIAHPEGGWYRETYRSEEKIPRKALPSRYDGDRSFFSEIYFLLERGDFSAFHRLKSDEVWHFYTGSPVTLHIIDGSGNYRKVVMGTDIFQLAIERGSWFAAEVESGDFSLVGCSVGPAFEFSDFEMGRKEEMMKLFPGHGKVIGRLTR